MGWDEGLKQRSMPPQPINHNQNHQPGPINAGPPNRLAGNDALVPAIPPIFPPPPPAILPPVSHLPPSQSPPPLSPSLSLLARKPWRLAAAAAAATAIPLLPVRSNRDSLL